MRKIPVAGASRSRPLEGRLAPDFFSTHTIVRELGRGGCGAVYLATPKSGGDPVAVKLMLSRAQTSPTFGLRASLYQLPCHRATTIFSNTRD